ncbi:MAG: hypothetical protein DMG49_02965 [Acidobacteria bacterium]|nr:MAG: hypothetical protein DMG49_02965 [Acidobacteriota bacterium]
MHPTPSIPRVSKRAAKSLNSQPLPISRIGDLGHGLRVAALAPDGVIEAVEHEPHKHWVVGVQWHPERMKDHALSSALFRALVQATRAAAAHR